LQLTCRAPLPSLPRPCPHPTTQLASARNTASAQSAPTVVMGSAADISATANPALFTALETSAERTALVPTALSSAVRRLQQCSPGATWSVRWGAWVRPADTCASACGAHLVVLARRAVKPALGSGARTCAMATRAPLAALGCSVRATAKEQPAIRAAVATSAPATTMTQTQSIGATRLSSQPKRWWRTTATVSGPRPSLRPSPQLCLV